MLTTPTWTAVTTGLVAQENGPNGLVVSPLFASDGTLFFAAWSGGIYRSTNRGDSWIAVNNGQPNRSPRCLAISPKYSSDRTAFLGTWGDSKTGGVYRTQDTGDNWTWLSSGLSTRCDVVNPSRAHRAMRMTTWSLQEEKSATAASCGYITCHDRKPTVVGALHRKENCGRRWVSYLSPIVVSPADPSPGVTGSATPTVCSYV
jgi:hypothetical protein